MKVLSQRDNRWRYKKLGWSNVTIGGYGCLITCLAMMADLLPDDVNERLKNVVGYANLNLVIWDKIKEAIPSLEFEWRGWSFDNDKVLETISKYGSCIVEVDFDSTPRTDDSHFVLFVGNKKMYDPWTGKEEPTSKYPIIKGFVVIRKKGENMYESEDLKECLRQHSKLVDECIAKGLKIKELEKEFELANKKIDKLIEANGILENKAETDLAKAKLDYEKLLADEKIAFKGELERVEEQHRLDLIDLEQKYKDVDLPEPEPKLKTFKQKLAKALEILFS